jgi:hypothetical protein
MIPLLVIAVWILVLALVAGLCVAARAGDRVQLADELAAVEWRPATGSATAAAWEPVDDLVISARERVAGSAVPAESVAPLVHSGGIAA